MKREKLSEFMNRVKVLNKDIGEYFNEETGVKYLVPTSYLWSRVEYLELTNDELKKAIFNQEVDKTDLKFNYIESLRPQSKYEVTKKEEDRYTIVEGKVKVNQIWVVSNGLKFKETFNNKEEALKLVDSINEELKKLM